ncbi:Transthyretin-like family protein, partial [Oesophagostomum dentatum]
LKARLIKRFLINLNFSDGIKLLEQAHSDDIGQFNIVGRSRSSSNWRPVLNVYHDCNDAKNLGRRKMNFLLPKRYVTEGENPGDPFDLGVWNLETAIKEDEERVDKITKRRRRFEDHHKADKHSRNSSLDRFEEPDERVDPW